MTLEGHGIQVDTESSWNSHLPGKDFHSEYCIIQAPACSFATLCTFVTMVRLRDTTVSLSHLPKFVQTCPNQVCFHFLTILMQSSFLEAND